MGKLISGIAVFALLACGTNAALAARSPETHGMDALSLGRQYEPDIGAIVVAQDDDDYETPTDGGIGAVDAWDRNVIQGNEQYYNPNTGEDVELPVVPPEDGAFTAGDQTYAPTDEGGYQTYDGGAWQDVTPDEPSLGEPADE